MGYLHNQNTISTKVGPALLANYLALSCGGALGQDQGAHSIQSNSVLLNYSKWRQMEY